MFFEKYNSFIPILMLFAFVFSFLCSFVGLEYLIIFFDKIKKFQPIRKEGPISHVNEKKYTPTMGGIILGLTILSSSCLFNNSNDIHISAIMIISMFFLFLGLIDDCLKVFKNDTKGLKGSIKIILQFIIVCFVILWLVDNHAINDTEMFLPFIKNNITLNFLYLPFVLFVIVGSANSVNLTDGLDGLVIIPILICSIVFLTISYFNKLFIINNNIDLKQISILCSSIIGTAIAFFIYNKYPAKIFMGDAGSLMYGALLGTISVILRQEIFFAIMGMIFIIETCSVILQITSFKLFKKRIFKMSPFHHHLEKSGWSENKIVYSFWIFSLIMALLALIGIIKI